MSVDLTTRIAAVQAYLAGHSPKAIAKHYGINRDQPRKWAKDPDKWLKSDEEKLREFTQVATTLPQSKPDSLYTSPAPKDTKPHGKVVLVIPDLHCPFHHPDALAFLQEVERRTNPDEIVNLGDEVDFHAFSRWPKDPDGLSPGGELRAAIEALIPFYVAFPKMRVCVSNHTIRPHKLMKLTGLPAAMLPAYSTMLNAPDGWSWHEHIIIDNVRYMHGDQGKGGLNGWTKNSEVYHQSVVVGHWHSKAGVYYDSAMFNVNAGCLIDPTAYAFDYARHSHKKANLGCAVVTGGRKAAFLPMLLDADGRWVGYL